MAFWFFKKSSRRLASSTFMVAMGLSVCNDPSDTKGMNDYKKI
jgi:hypothetical protein